MSRVPPRAICHVGGYPPPLGGISLHVQRLDALCRREGFESVVIDPYGGAPEPPSIGAHVVRVRGSKPRRAARLLWAVRQSRADIVHFHLAAQDNFLAIAPMALAASRGRLRVATLHSGRFVQHYWKRLGPVRLMSRRVFRVFDHVIATNANQRQFLVDEFGLPERRITLAPSFLLTPALSGQGQQPLPEIARFCEIHPRIALVTGYCRPLYGFHTVIEALDVLRDARLGAILNFYSIADPEYKAHLLRMTNGRSDVIMTTDMPEPAFHAMLRRVTLFVRPTSTDGDSVALREAIWYGRQIVATDVAPRPEGTLLFKYGDATGLAQALATAIADPTTGRCTPGVDSGALIVRLYRDLAGTS